MLNSLNKTADTTRNIKPTNQWKIANVLEKTPEQVISENLELLIGKNQVRTLPEDKREKHRNNHQLVTKVIWNQEIDFIYPEIIPELIDNESLKKNYKYFEEILNASWGIKDWKHLNNVNDWWLIYRELEKLNVPKWFASSSVGPEKLKRDNWFSIVVYNPKTEWYDVLTVYKDKYQLTALVTDTYHVAIGLPNNSKK